MTILAFDTCFAACSAALWSPAGGGLRASRFEAMDKGHSERIVPMIAEVLAQAGASLDDVDTIAVTVGPGSFTGVRTGLAVARALALARGIAVRGTTSLHVMAAALRETAGARPVAIVIATRDGYVYFQSFEAVTGRPAGSARLASPANAARALGDRVHLVAGSGAAPVVAAVDDIRHQLADGPVEVDARVLARLAGDLPLLNPPEPLYLREPDAKPQPGHAPSLLPPRH